MSICDNVRLMSESITFSAVVSKVTTLADGGIRVALDLSENSIMTAAQLMECKRAGVALNVQIGVLQAYTNGADKTHERTADATPALVGG